MSNQPQLDVAPAESDEARTLQALLRQVRVEAGLRQIDLAIRLKRPQSFISNLESGERHVDFLELRLICAELGISLEEFTRRFEALLHQGSDCQ